MKKALLSVIVPVYNVEPFLRQCIDSITKQTLKELEIILVDDGSPDKSGEIIDEYASVDDRIISIHKKNGGISSARTIGLSHANGSFIAFVDSDDWLELDMYEKMIGAAEKYNADIVSCSSKVKKDVIHKKDIVYEFLIDGENSMCNKVFRNNNLWDGFEFDKGDVSIDVKGCYDLFLKCRCWVDIPGQYYNIRTDNVSYGRSGFSKRDLNTIKLTSIVAEDARNISKKAYNAAMNHVVHAEMDIISKAARYGYKTEDDEQLFKSFFSKYQRSIRMRLFRSLVTSYFSKTEKVKLILISISFNIYKKVQKKYLDNKA